MRVLISGSHGLIGTELIRQLEARGDEAVRLVRSPHEQGVYWDLRRFRANPDDFERFDAIVHLTGENIGERRLTERRKQEIWDSRIVNTEFLCQTLDKVSLKPKTLISASAVGFYGNRGDEVLTEESGKGKGFFAELCDYWENAARDAEKHGIRVVNLRSGVVLSEKGGALPRQIPLFKMGVGGRLGNGHQWLSWISLEDEVRAILHLLDYENISGPVNVTAPNPVKNGAFTAVLAMTLKRPAIFPVPAAILNVMLGKALTEELLLTSQCAIPEKLRESGFAFKHAIVGDALQAAINPPTEDEEEDEQQDPDEAT